MKTSRKGSAIDFCACGGMLYVTDTRRITWTVKCDGCGRTYQLGDNFDPIETNDFVYEVAAWTAFFGLPLLAAILLGLL